MRYAGLMKNDIADGLHGICVSFWFQGCENKCNGCQNPQTFDKNGGMELPTNYIDMICDAITANGIKRNLSLLGGDGLAPYNLELTYDIVKKIREKFNNIEIILWTGYTLNELRKRSIIESNGDLINKIFYYVDYVIDGRYEKDKRDVTLKLRGSSNQRIYKFFDTYFGNIKVRDYTDVTDDIDKGINI